MSKQQYWSKVQSSRHCDSIDQGYTENAAPLTYHKNWSTYPVPKEPTKNCIFCHEFHWSHLCLEVATLEKRIQLFEIFGFCFLCGKRQHAGSCSCGDIWCKWPQCGAKNEHNTTLCPNIAYPINEDIVQTYHNHVDYVWKLRSECVSLASGHYTINPVKHLLSSVNSFNDTSLDHQRKDRKRNRKLSSKAKTLTFGCHSNMVT